VAGLVGVSQTAYGGAASPDAGQSFELLAIACVVLGGTRVTGGYGSILWTALGIATLSHLKIGFGLNRIRQFHIPGLARPVSLDADMQLILIGLLVILVAVLNERLAGRRRD
jgi:ribose/xylose/arabinose/galactoside ABC-type transport system permease subunit